MKRIAPIALATALLALAAACHKDNKEAQLKALDEAYKSGVFTKEEYDAKRQALAGPPPAAPAAPAPTATAPATAVEPPPPVNPPAAALPDTSAAQPTAAAAPPVAAAPPPVSAAPAPAGAVPRRSAAAAPPPMPAQTVPTPAQTIPSPAQTMPVPAPVSPQPAPRQAAPPPAVEPAEPEPAPLAGCQDAESRAGGPNTVQERFFPASEDSVRQAALQAFANLDFIVHRNSEHEIEASKKRHLSVVVGAGGEKVTLHFSSGKKNGQLGTRVTAETKKSFTGKLAQKSWTTAVLAQITCNLRGR